jgi:hypothetical protein
VKIVFNTQSFDEFYAKKCETIDFLGEPQLLVLIICEFVNQKKGGILLFDTC